MTLLGLLMDTTVWTLAMLSSLLAGWTLAMLSSLSHVITHVMTARRGTVEGVRARGRPCALPSLA